MLDTSMTQRLNVSDMPTPEEINEEARQLEESNKHLRDVQRAEARLRAAQDEEEYILTGRDSNQDDRR